MDTSPAYTESSADTLSYTDNVPYDEQISADPIEIEPETIPEASSGLPQLADRIGNTKVYLLSEATGTRLGKRKHGEQESQDADAELDEDSPYRSNAILVRGSPISHLPTASIFAYATHFDAKPIALEWIDDTTCILVFSTKATARIAYRRLSKSIAEEPSTEDSSVTAKPIPVALWPPEDRINKSLGKGEGLKGVIRMRWALRSDVKRKGANKESEFYRKYGSKAGKGGADAEEEREEKRRRRDNVDDLVQKARLDDELDAFLADEPPSKMHADRMDIDTSGRTLLDRTSVMRAQPDALSSRLVAELPRRARSSRGRDDGRRQDHQVREKRGGRRRSHKTQQDLDDELDAFLNSRD